jgi:hypothetical protein
VQAQLVAQLLCCIPLTSIEPVLTWLTSAMSQSEQKDLLLQVSTPAEHHIRLCDDQSNRTSQNECHDINGIALLCIYNRCTAV